MKIGVISSTVFPCPPHGYAGLEMIAWQCAEELAERGHDVTLFAPHGSQVLKTKLFAFGEAGKIDEKTAYSNYWNQLPNYDVIIDHTWEKWPFNLRMEGVLKAPVLSVLHAPVDRMFRELPKLDKTCFVCISNDQKVHFEGLFGRSARYVYNGIDMDFYKNIGLPRNDRFLFLARFSSIKGPDLAIEACIKAGVALDLIGDTTITGEPELYARCHQMVKEHNSKVSPDKQFRILGGKSRGECVFWMNQAYCMIHPNERFREPFGLAPVEAMACGCPVIAWNNGAMKETVVHTGTGWLVSNMDELIETLRNYRVTDQIRKNCREWVSKFSVQEMAASYEALCFEAVKTGGW